MRKIASFMVDHDRLKKGMYVSRVDGDAVTYDIRMKIPNAGDYLGNGELHTIEHLFATFARNSELSASVIYVGPMGCRTGFYLVMRDEASHTETIEMVKAAFRFIADFEGEIPGAKRRECGNYLEHDLAGAKRVAEDMCGVLKNWTQEMLRYEA